MAVMETIGVMRPAPPPAELGVNSFFAWEHSPAHGAGCPFIGAMRVTLAPNVGAASVLEVAAGAGATIRTYHDPARDICAYVWGLPAHPDLSQEALIRWMIEKLDAGQAVAFRELVGTFIVLIDDRRNRRFSMISDLLGLRPWFVGTFNGRLVCGSDVWAIHEARLNAGGVNYDAVASWVRQGYDNTRTSLFADYAWIGAGVVAMWEKGVLRQLPYASYTGARKTPPRAELLEVIHHHVSRAFDAATRELDRVTISLSGGYDSRYLAALAAGRPRLNVEAFTVADRESESEIAAVIARRLRIPLKVIPTDGSAWNMYHEPFHFMHNGFPITKQTIYLAARQRPRVPCLNGFVGDGILRDILESWRGKTEHDLGEGVLDFYQQVQRLDHEDARFDLLDPDFMRRCDERTLGYHRANLERWTSTEHRFLGIGLFVKQRTLFANNFLQHLDIAEPILPFVSYDLIEYRFQNDTSCFGFDTYADLFRTYFPDIGDVPHNSKIAAHKWNLDRPSRHTRLWAAHVLKGLMRRPRLAMLNRRKALPRLIGAMAGRASLEVAARFLYRLLLLEERLEKAGVSFDWGAI